MGERVIGKRGSGFWWGFGEAAVARERVAATEDEELGYGVKDKMFVATTARRSSKFRPMVKPISPFPHFYNVVLYPYLDFGFAFKLHCLLT
nr:hypothetical protein CFP56_27500 [Quercus suber]